MAQFSPQFNQKAEMNPQEKVRYTTDLFDLTEEQEEQSTSQKLSFFFICDRSGSMYDIRIGLVREAL